MQRGLVLHCSCHIGANRDSRCRMSAWKFHFLGPESRLKSGLACTGLLCTSESPKYRTCHANAKPTTQIPSEERRGLERQTTLERTSDPFESPQTAPATECQAPEPRHPRRCQGVYISQKPQPRLPRKCRAREPIRGSEVSNTTMHMEAGHLRESLKSAHEPSTNY